MGLAFVALRLRVWNLLFNLFILRHADYRYVDISLPIVLFCFFLFKFTQSRNPVDAATIRRRGERFLTSKSGRGQGVGLQNVHNIASRAKGTCSFSIEEGTFLARITLPYGEKTR